MDKLKEIHPKNLGMLIGNFHSLEFLLRMVVLKYENKIKGTPLLSKRLINLKTYDCVPENALTNYDTLGEMIKKYNKIIKGFYKNLMVDQALVDLRDAIAHGRVFINGNSDSFQLLKFSQPRNGHVKVEFCANMTEEWFRKHINVLRGNIIKVQLTLEKLEHGELF